MSRVFVTMYDTTHIKAHCNALSRALTAAGLTELVTHPSVVIDTVLIFRQYNIKQCANKMTTQPVCKVPSVQMQGRN